MKYETDFQTSLKDYTKWYLNFISKLLNQLFSFSYTPLVIAIQQMLEYDNNNRLPDTKVSHFFSILQLYIDLF